MLKPLPHPEAVGEGYVHRVSVYGLSVSDFPLGPPSGRIEGYRVTRVVFGPLTIEKRLLPLSEGRARVLLVVRSSEPVDVTIEDRLPGGGKKTFQLESFAGEKTFSYDLEGEVWLTDPAVHWGKP